MSRRLIIKLAFVFIHFTSFFVLNCLISYLCFKAALGYTAVAAAAAAVCERSARFITKADICLRMPGLLADKVLSTTMLLSTTFACQTCAFV